MWGTLATCIATLLCVAACGNGPGSSGGNANDGSSGGALGSGPTCANGTSQGVAKVRGTLAGQPVSVDQTPASGGFSQLSTGQFDLPINVTINQSAVGVDPGSVQMHLTWTVLVADGQSADATGTIVLPTGQPYAQMSLCAGSGSKISPNAHGLDFVLDHLTLGPACTQAVAGELLGCWGYASNTDGGP